MQDFVIPTETVSWGKDSANSVVVRGLSYNDFVELFTEFGKAVDILFEVIEGGEAKIQSFAENGGIKEFGAGMIKKSPQLVAKLIALATDSPSQATQVARMPLPVQMRLLEAVYRLTVEEAGGLADFLQLVLKIAREVRDIARAVNPAVPLENIGS